MTRYTNMQKKTHEKAGGFNVMPLAARKNDAHEDQNSRKRKHPGTEDEWKKRRPVQKKTDTVCFGCRKKGHSVTNCKETKRGAHGICYNCGSTEHSLSKCRKPRKGNALPYAKCFVCQGEGHLAGQCPQNERGMYPNGGGCRICGQVDHLVKDCKVTREQAGSTVIGKIDTQQGADDDDYHIFVTEKQKSAKETQVVKEKESKQPVKKKIVRF